ncbi:MAG: histidine kinase [Lachnospiraceae bacterium]|nr:histidine kinase [Lachnospiraceae bacterium]
MPRINYIVDFFLALMVMVTLLGNLVGKREKNKQSGVFNGMLFFDMLMLFCNSIVLFIIHNHLSAESAGWRFIRRLFDGAVNFSYYCILALFLYFLTEIIAERQKVPYWVVNLGVVVCMFYGLLWFISEFNGIIYSYEQGQIVKGSLYEFGQYGGYLVAALSLYLIIYGRKTFRRMEILIMLLFVAVPLIGAGLRQLFPDIQFMPIVLTLSLMIQQSFIQMNREFIIQEQKAELEKARTDIMMTQIRPHFIFNALNVIYILCDISVERAKEGIDVFAEYLRENFRALGNSETVSFKQELKHIENYLTIEKLRFDDQLEIVYDIRCEDFKVPPLSLQPLVENAVRHGIQKKKGGGAVRIGSRELDDCYLIEIIDDGEGFEVTEELLHGDKENRHIGMSNSRYRLEKMCHARIEVDSKIGKGTEVRIRIPKKV